MTRVLVSQQLFDDSLDIFDGSRIELDVLDRTSPMPGAELTDRLTRYDGLICLLTDRVDTAMLQANPQLKVVANVAVGCDNIDLEEAGKLGITVTNTPDVLTETTADLALALMLAVARRIPEADAFTRTGDWSQWELHPRLTGVDISGKTLGLFGMGRIGKAVARRAVFGFGMRLVYTSRSPLSADDERGLGAQRVDLDELLAEVDVLSLHAPLTQDTRHVIGAAELAAMRSTAILVNTARGALVDESALAKALRDGAIWGAGLDVFEDEPRVNPDLVAQRDRVVLAPHLGSATIETRRRMARMAAANAHAVLTGQAAPNPITV